MKLLGVLLCYNDAEILPEAIEYLLGQNHDLIVWNHGSTDETQSIIDRYSSSLLETQLIPRDFDFYKLYGAMSQHLIENWVDKYDWISWPDQDEFLEGPNRSMSYAEWVGKVLESEYDWVQFANFNYWFTTADDPSIKSAPERIRHYGLFANCSPRIRAWRAKCTNNRYFNHNPPEGTRYPEMFKLRHYPMRSHAQMMKRLEQDRANLGRGGANQHYKNMSGRIAELTISPDKLFVDDGVSELDLANTFDWRAIYNVPPAASDVGGNPTGDSVKVVGDSGGHPIGMGGEVGESPRSPLIEKLFKPFRKKP